jgi:hypothetical protein
MNKLQRLMLALPFVSSLALATDYTVDFSRVENLESIRPLVKQCRDFDALEIYRTKLETTANLEDLRKTLSGIGFGMFIDCPDTISGPGIAPVAASEPSTSTGYGVDFTRVEDFETLRPLIEQCADFGGLESFRDRLQSTDNLETMRQSLTEVGFALFDECPEGVSGPGITPDK